MTFEEIKKLISTLETFPESSITMSVISSLLDVSDIKVVDKLEFAYMLDDLMVRLAENYQVINEEQSEKILEWIDTKWTEDDLEFIDLMISIAIKVSPDKAKPFFETKMFSAKKQSIKGLLLEAYDEIKTL